MLTLSSRVEIHVALAPADMRCGFDGLSARVRSVLELDPLSGHLFVFHNRRRDRIKILFWDGDGFWLWYKRLEKGTFRFPRGEESALRVGPAELGMILGGLDLRQARRRERYRLPR